MARDANGNDLNAAKVVTTSMIALTPYDSTKRLEAAMIAPTVTDPTEALSSIFTSLTDSSVGLITSDGAPQDARDSGDSIEFHQPGYLLPGDPTLTLQFTAAEDNPVVSQVTIGKADETGVYHVSDTIQSVKFIAYQQTNYRNGEVRRRLGVVQPTAAEPQQDSRGAVAGMAITLQWCKDVIVDDSRSFYLEAVYDPKFSAETVAE